ncbi:PilW family protein [Cupriavidus metallidurans]|uniref:PilW family protein n=2 Tax=Cupriavidus TaxID=106589 RepID=UPI0009B8DD39|nr:PilW family protein [Cupriavidus metallidurans]
MTIPRSRTRLSRTARQTGLSLIELMVVLVISMIIVGAVFGMMSVSEGRKRTTMSVNDINQGGMFALYQLDKAVRSAGSGFSQNWPLTYGCRLNVNLNGDQILPLPATIAAPFTGLPAQLGGLRLAPVLIVQNGTPLATGSSDVLITMAGNAGFGEIPAEFSGTAPALAGNVVNLSLVNTMTFNDGNLVLVADRNDAQGNVQPCYVGQVQTGFTGSVAVQLPLAGAYNASAGKDGDATSISATGIAMNLGNVGAGNLPGFAVYGVGANQTLMFYDLLQSGGNGYGTVPLADGVLEMHALYGIDPNNNGTISWQAPTGAFDAAQLSNGSQTAAANLYAIKAVRIGLILRTSLPERAQQLIGSPSTATATGVVSPGPLVLFADVPGLSYTRTLQGAEQNYRYRVFETTIPLRNTLLQR